jgi:CBS domain-containing protein
MEVRTIMTRDPITLTPDDDLATAMALMDEKKIRHVPVVDGAALVGVITDRDLLTATGWLPVAERPADAPKLVKELLGRKPVVASPDDSTVMAAVDLTSREIGSLPVVEDGKLVGILTEMDLLRVYWEMCSPGGGLKGLHEPIADLMVENPLTITPETTLGEVEELEEKRRIRHFPVLSGEALVGVLSNRDLRRARGQRLADDTAVFELMTPDPFTLPPTDSLLHASGKFLDEKISALLIAEEKKLVGILTVTDLLNHCIPNLRTPGN